MAGRSFVGGPLFLYLRASSGIIAIKRAASFHNEAAHKF